MLMEPPVACGKPSPRLCGSNLEAVNSPLIETRILHRDPHSIRLEPTPFPQSSPFLKSFLNNTLDLDPKNPQGLLLRRLSDISSRSFSD
jgi:hypothetical protein